MLVRMSGAMEADGPARGYASATTQSSTLTLSQAANVGDELDSESWIREIRPSGLMRGRSLTVFGCAFQPVGSGLLY